VTASATLLVTLVRVLALQPEDGSARMSEALAIMGVASALMGNAMALVQVQPKRVLACLSISHIGFALIAVATDSPVGNAALAFSLLVFVFANVGSFAVLVALSRDGEPCRSVDELQGLFNRRSGLAAALALFLLALGGAPGTGGFVAKFAIVTAAVDAGHVTLAIAAVLGAFLGAIASLRVVLAMVVGDDEDLPEELRLADETEDEPTAEMSSLDLGILSLCAVAVIATGVAPPWTTFANAAKGLEPAAVVLPAAEDADVALPSGDVELVE
jgi:NADH-quinone oxidoreductase subunit N